MIASAISNNAALVHGIVAGGLGGVALVLTAVFSRRGPAVLVPYGCLTVGLIFLLAQYPSLTFRDRFAISATSFVTATVFLYVSVIVRSNNARNRLIAVGRLARDSRVQFSLNTLLARLALVVGAGSAASAAVAYLAG